MSIALTTLENGIRVVTHEMRDLYTASLSVQINAGSRDERADQHGISHLLEHMAFKGTHARSALEIVESIEAVGGDLNAATSVETTTYYARVLKENIDLGIDILADILANSKIDAQELEREQHVILQEIGAAHDTPDDMVFDHALETAFSGQAIGRPILGTEQMVIGFKKDHIKDYLKSHYHAPSMIIAASGGVKHDMLVGYCENLFSQFQNIAAPQRDIARYTGGSYIDDKPLEQVHLILGFEGIAYHDEDIYAAQILSGILGGGMSSRLFQEIREKRGLCYSIYSFHWSFSDTGFFGIYGATSEEDCKELMPVTLDVIKSVLDDINEAELSKTKAQVKAALMMTLENSAARSEQLARHVHTFGHVRTTEDILDSVNKVGKKEIIAVAERIFSSAPTLSAIGPVQKLMDVDAIKGYLSKA